jgi:hypothetical protein
MSEVIKGPWRQPQSPDLTPVLADEVARMTRALEQLRELHRRSERAVRGERPAVGDARKE